MKLPKEKIEAAASERYTLQAVLYDVEQKAWVATDGHILAFIPCVPEKGDKTCLVPLRAFRFAKEIGAKVSLQGSNIHVQDKDDDHIFAKTEGNFPNYKSLIPKGNVNCKAKITLDLALLTRLAEALSPRDCDKSLLKIEVHINGQNEMAVVRRTDTDNPSAIGLIMPVLLPEP